MPRTTQTLVEGIIEVDLVAWSDLTPFIEIANELVTECCGDVGYSDTRLQLIETWLAAHFYAVADPRRNQESVRGLSETKPMKIDLNLAQTTYGQQAMLMDTKGGLATLNRQTTNGGTRTATVTWGGTEACP